jgi:hypothetical protein
VCVPIRRPPVVVCMYVGNHVESRAAGQSACKAIDCQFLSSRGVFVDMDIILMAMISVSTFEVLRIRMENVRGPRAT